MTQNELITIGDLQQFKLELIAEIKTILNNAKKEERKWLRSKDIRNMLGISPGTLQNMRISGALEYTKVNGIFFYKYDDVVKAMTKRKDNE